MDIKSHYKGNIVIIGQHTGNMGDEIAGCALLQNLIEGGEVQKVEVIYRGWDERKLEITDEKIKHITSLSLSKLDVLNLFISTLVLKKKIQFYGMQVQS